ncbi:MAG: hypothetical protein QMD09_12060, partial [Desulfatibacillaceae bacterium]|nr:hypothetical protein [Desulfatibacillaceae bacterium]
KFSTLQTALLVCGFIFFPKCGCHEPDHKQRLDHAIFWYPVFANENLVLKQKKIALRRLFSFAIKYPNFPPAAVCTLI